MTFVLHDIIGAVAALPIIFAIVMFPGRLFAGALAFPGFSEARSVLERAGISLLVGIATMPVLLDLAGRGRPHAMVALAVALSLMGFLASLRGSDGLSSKFGTRRSFLLFIAIFTAWIVAAIFLLIDLPEGEGLRRSMLSVDHVKHAAATWAIAQWGTPPENPTFFDPHVKSAYYYFFYNLTAVAQLIGAPMGVVARHAAWAGVVMAGVGLFVLLRVVYLRWNLQREGIDASNQAIAPWLLILLLTTGLDILPVTLIGRLFYGVWMTDAEGWDTQVTSWANSVLWTPHHICGLIATWVALIALTEASSDRARKWRLVALAGLAFASCAGLSVYVALGAALTITMWLCWLAVARRGEDLATWFFAGATALAFGGPWLLSLVEGRPIASEAPIAFEIRALPIVDPLLTDPAVRATVRLLAAPLAYAIEFGVYLIGSYLFWKKAGWRGLNGDLSKLLVLGTIASLVVGTFLRSTIMSNDLGWRVMLFAQTASLLWTLAAVKEGLFHIPDSEGRPRYATALWTCIGLGFAANLYGAYQIRISTFETLREVEIASAERNAWEWMSTNLPANVVVQEFPDRPRAFAYGLYGHFREAVSDRYNSVLFGSSKPIAEARIRETSALFVDQGMTREAALALAARLNIGVVVIRALDPVFASHESWPWSIDAVYANKYMRVIDIAGQKDGSQR